MPFKQIKKHKFFTFTVTLSFHMFYTVSHNAFPHVICLLVCLFFIVAYHL